ncbi:MAG: DeoR/GlpR transcriptional regulator, partial [Firmicutes bacterium]|nr:DeoR/GlpR transcriptional regulator [Bacillota bacterium]
GDSLFISAGTTCAELARVLPVFPLKVVSNGIYTVNNIAALPNISDELLGGDVDLTIMRTQGVTTLDQLRSRHFSIAFIGTIGINLNYGFAHNNAIITAILERVTQRADRTVVLADASKITDKFSPHTLSFGIADTIVTDDRFPEDVVEALRTKGLEVI